MKKLLFIALLTLPLFAKGVIGETFSVIQTPPAQDEVAGKFIIQIGAFNNPKGAELLREKNGTRFSDKRIEVREVEDAHAPYRVWLHDFPTYKAARKYIELHAIDGFIIEIKQ